MAKWFYFDKSGSKIGPVESEGMRKLAESGLITPETVIETESGRQSTAGKIQGLVFSATQYEPISRDEPEEYFNPFSTPNIKIIETLPPPPPPRKALITVEVYGKYDQTWLENLGDWCFEPKISPEAWDGDYPYHERRRQKLMKSAKGIWKAGVFVIAVVLLIAAVGAMIALYQGEIAAFIITLFAAPCISFVVFYVTHHLAAWYKFLAETILMQLNMERFEKRQVELLEASSI